MKVSCIMSCAAAVLLALCAAPGPGFCAPVADEGQRLFETKCSACHGLDRVKSRAKTEKEWRATVSRMKSKGAVLSDGEAKAIVVYLAEKYPAK